MVLARHAVRPFFDTATAPGPLLPIGPWDAATPFVNGWMGVDLFFVLSGFLITTQICNRYRGFADASTFGDYIKQRLLRILPAYYFVLFLAAAGAIPLYHVAPEALALRVGYHLLFLQDYLPSNIVVAFWSLGVEEKFYIVAPFVLMLAFRLRRRAGQVLVLGALALIPPMLRAMAAQSHPEVTTYEPFFRIFRSPFNMSFDGLVVGSLCALLYRDRERWLTSRRVAHAIFWAGAILALGLNVATIQLDQIGWFQEVPLQSLLAVGMGGILLGLVLGGGPLALFQGRWMLVVARLSYCLYLVHLTVLPAAQRISEWLVASSASMSLKLLVLAPTFLILSFAAAMALHYAVEKPFLLLKERIRLPQTPPINRA